jgi:hypothetical protein
VSTARRSRPWTRTAPSGSKAVSGRGRGDHDYTFLGRLDLRAADSIHLATAVTMGAHRFITNNSKDFGAYIEEIDVTFPADLPG